MAYILGIETSCDETAASVTKDGREVLSNVVYSQIPLHTIYGGVVPEIASRKHIDKIIHVIDAALSEANLKKEELDAVAVTYNPGLVGALLVGVSVAKAFAYSIKKPLVSYYEHNLRQRGEEIIARLEAGETCALVSDAGMPAVSDPGEQLVKQCYEHGLKVSAIPGPCAFVSAIAISGLSTKRFTFEGFLSTAKNSRRERLESVKNLEHTLIFYEAPHKLKGFLEDLLKVLGNRRISLVREISKIYEQVMLTTVEEAIGYYSENEPRGEFVIIVEGSGEEKEEISEASLEQEFFSLVEGGMAKTLAAKTLARKYNLSKREIYERFK